MELRHYQADSITLAKNSLASGNKRIVIDLATGGGKSLICETIIRGALGKGKRVMFLVNRVQLADQMSDHLNRARIEHGVIQGQNTRATYQDCIIASIDTIHARGYPEVDLIIADEIHGAAGSKKYLTLIEHYKDIPIIGVTATSFVKGLGKQYSFGKLFEDVVRAITIPELIEQGFLVDVDIYAPTEPDLKDVKIVAGDYHEEQLAEAMNKPMLVGDIIKTWNKLGQGKQTIVFAVDIAHSMHIVNQFIKNGVSAEHIDYKMTYDEKKDIVKRFKNREFTVLSNCSLLAEGFDAPATEVMILARPTKNLKRYMQMAGRILRIHDNISVLYKSYMRLRDGIQRIDAVENGRLPREYGSGCCGIEVRDNQAAVVQALEQSEQFVFDTEGAYLPSIIESREGEISRWELLDSDDTGEELQRSQASVNSMDSKPREQAASQSQGREQAEQPSDELGMGFQLGKHETRTRAWIVPSRQWKQSRDEQINKGSSDRDKERIEKLSLWIIDETGTKVRSAENNNIRNKGWEVLGACFIADNQEDADILVKKLSELHIGNETILVCLSSEDTGQAARIVGVNIKKLGIILDHSGSTRQLGYPTEHREVFLDDGKPKQSTGSDKKEKKEFELSKCTQCHYLRKKSGKCPICGHAPVKQSDVVSTAGELKILTKKEKAKQAKLAGLDKQNVYSELLYMRDDRGYKHGWESRQYRNIFGVWPRGLIECKRIPSAEVKNIVTAAMIRFSKGSKNAQG